MAGIHTELKPPSLNCTFPPQPLSKTSIHSAYSCETEETPPTVFEGRQDAPSEVKINKNKAGSLEPG